MILRQLSSISTPPCSFIVSSSRSICRRQRKRLATSAQKRKWRREQADKKPFVKKKNDTLTSEDGKTTIQRKNSKSTDNNWQPLLFLGIFPLFMSIVVVLNREDLRQEVNAKGIGRFLEDYKRWRRSPRATHASTEQQQGEHVGEYEKVLYHLEVRNDSFASTNFTRRDGNNTDLVISESSNLNICETDDVAQ